MNHRLASLAFAATIAAGTIGAALAPASAQPYGPPPPPGVPVYNAWQAQWDQYQFDRHHVILGEVVGFQPYRVQIQRRDGSVQQVDLKNGTIILPTGATPTPGEHVALVGYYSRGTFVVNRLLIR